VPDLFSNKPQKVFVEGENPDNQVPLGEDDDNIFTEGQDGVVGNEIDFNDDVFTEGQEGQCGGDIDFNDDVFTEGQEGVIESELFETGVFIPGWK